MGCWAEDELESNLMLKEWADSNYPTKKISDMLIALEPSVSND